MEHFPSNSAFIFSDQLPSAQNIESYFDRLWPICRSLTGDGVRSSLKILQEIIPFNLYEVPTGTQVFDWKVPKEWNISDAYIEDAHGKKIVDFKQNNLHVLNYSCPVNEVMPLETLQKHLYSLPEQPNAIPYLTSYYKERWGFCITQNQRDQLEEGNYKVVIQSSLTQGSLTYGDLILPSTEGRKEEILLSTYCCHPSLANNELSGPLVMAFLYQALKQWPKRKYNYRFVIVPETIGAITYLSKHGDHLRQHCSGGLVLTCCGDDKAVTYKKSKRGNTLMDLCVEHVIMDYCQSKASAPIVHDFFPTGSDERQYCSAGFNLPVGSLMRSMYATYPEYHTSLDNKDFISFEAMVETIEIYLRVMDVLECNVKYQCTAPYGEPQLSPRGLYPSLGSQKQVESEITKILYLTSFSDGEHDLLTIAGKMKDSFFEVKRVAQTLEEKGLLKKVKDS